MNPDYEHRTSPDPFALDTLGWDESFASAFERYRGAYTPGRVSSRHRTVFEVVTVSGLVQAGLSGALHRAGRMPAVGDFVVLLHRPEDGVSMIVDILPRKTVFTRGIFGKGGDDQVIAANIDTVFIVTAAGSDLNSRRLERYLAIVHASGAKPAILINKSDLAADPSALAEEVSSVASEVPVVTISAATGSGLSLLDPFLLPGRTVALIGSSGVGKSTLINALLRRTVQDTRQVREYDGKGRHKTSVRQLFILENGALVIDNPGLREVGMGASGSGIDDTFPEIRALAAGCRFSDCRHEHEPGCVVREAVEKGLISQDRLKSYIRLNKELAFQQEKAEIGLTRYERKRWKEVSKSARHISDFKE
ncbi:MAG: ribosome small subunit-dependent GTPase A [Methanomicrobiaceae archaeon]|uniref:Putative gtpase n=1 Tax=hydrocarbon metagenome TaxID=938273 RepID=A0A0W8FEU0_9ZZZZ|nr:ribosome small subunit-dependent GTPase A [Methanomicrobiaceae archaeon]MDD5419030.1 ribosome small subunit-dependent GTPase A [Methanomicrobiaceae archaeon]